MADNLVRMKRSENRGKIYSCVAWKINDDLWPKIRLELEIKFNSKAAETNRLIDDNKNCLLLRSQPKPDDVAIRREMRFELATHRSKTRAGECNQR